MKKNFKLGEEFFTATGKWLCTDIGTRVIVAIHLNQENPINYNGHPYSIPENVFDEYDMEGCGLDQNDFEDKQERGQAHLIQIGSFPSSVSASGSFSFFSRCVRVFLVGGAAASWLRSPLGVGSSRAASRHAAYSRSKRPPPHVRIDVQQSETS